MKFKNKYRLMLYQTYFDTGYSLTRYLFYMVALFGLTTQDLFHTLALAVVYGISCFFLGWLYFKHHWADAKAEVSNNYNPFVRHVKRKI